MYTAAVVGLGQIGQGYDYDHNCNDRILSHASAFFYHPEYKLIGGVDSNSNCRKKFESKFNCRSYGNLSSLYEEVNPDILALAVPTKLHNKLFHEIAGYSPKAIICEKPIANDLHSAKEIISVAQKKQIVLLVNYIRRFEPGVAKIKKLIQDDKLGVIKKVVGHYSKGLLNNGSHLIDLIKFLFDKFEFCSVIKPGRKWETFDPEPDVYCKSGDIDLYLIAGEEEYYSRFELEIIGSKGIIAYRNGGKLIQQYPVVKNQVFRNYQFLSEKGIEIPNDYLRYQWHVLENLARHLEDGVPLNSTGMSAYSTLKDVMEIINKLEENN